MKPHPITEAFKKIEEKYREFVNNIKIGIFRATSDGDLIEVRRSAVVMSRYRDTLKFLNLKMLDLHQNPDDNKKFMKEMEENRLVKNKDSILRKK